MFTFIGVNGINSDGDGSTDLLLDELRRRGHECIDVNQPIRYAWSVRSKQARSQDAMDIVMATPIGSRPVLIGHSYGGIKCAMAMQYANYHSVYLFRPAISRHHKFPMWNGPVTCIYSPKDWTVWAGSALFWHPFGQAGVRGFADPNVTNIHSPFSGHSGDFRQGVKHWANYILNDLTLRQAESES